MEEPARRLLERRHAEQPARDALDARRDRPAHRDRRGLARRAARARGASSPRCPQARPTPAAMLARETLEAQIAALRARLERIPYLDPIDLRFRNRVRVPVPTTKAVMFCLMDVSGSMDEARKDLAKRFFILLYLFLTRHYEKIDLVFIRHHTQAQEVDEENFFHARETGGTVVSSALVLMDEIITRALLAERVEHLRRAGQRRRQLAPRQRPLPRAADREAAAAVPLLRLRAGGRGRAEPVGGVRPAAGDRSAHFAMRKVTEASQIYPVFRDLFKKEGGGGMKHAPPAVVARHASPARRAAAAPGAHDPAGAAAAPGRAPEAPLPDPSDWSFELIEQYHEVIRATAAALRPRHLSEPARGHHRRADDGRLRVRRHAGELPPLELRQGVHRHREELPARPHGPGLRDRHQLAIPASAT